MTDMRERVARAICKHDALGLNPDDPQVNRDPVTGEPGLRPAWMEHIAQADAALLACGYAEMSKALEELTTTCFAEFGEGENEPDNSSVFVGEDNDSITFGMLRRARSILERTGEK